MAENHAWNMQSWRFFSNNQDKGFLTACEWTIWFCLMQRWQSKHRSLTFAHQQLKRCWHWWRNEGVFWGVGLIASKQTQVHFIHAILLYILWLYHVPFFHQTCVLRDCINTVTFWYEWKGAHFDVWVWITDAFFWEGCRMFKVFPVYFTFIASSFAISSAGFLIGLIGTMYTLQITPMGWQMFVLQKS